MEKVRKSPNLKLVGGKEVSQPELDPVIRKGCRKIALWAIRKTDLTFRQRDGGLGYLREEIGLTQETFGKAALELIRRGVITTKKSRESLTRPDIFTIHPKVLVEDPQLKTRVILREVSLLNGGNNDPQQKSAA